MPRGMKLAAVVLAALLVAAVTAALVLPSLIDWNRHRAAIAAALAEATGRLVRIGGDLDVAVLPVPRISVRDVTIANVAGGQAPPLAHFEALEARLAPGALLSGKIRIETVRLERPVLHLEILPDGRGNWALASGTEPPESDQRDAEGGTGAGARIALDRLLIADGLITYTDARSGRRGSIEDIEAEISAASLAGPFAAGGSFSWRGVPLALTATIGALRRDAPVPVDLALRREDSAAMLGFEGALGLAAVPRAEGRLVASGPDLARALAGIAGAPEDAPSPLLTQPFRVEAGMVAESGTADLREVRLALGELRAQGIADARFGETTDIEARLAFAPIDLDALLRALRAAETKQRQSKTDERVAQPSFVPPSDLRLTVTATAPAIKYRGGVIQDAEILANLAEQTATLSRASARLPGGSMLSLAGAVRFASAPHPGAAEPSFQGIAEFSSDSLRGFLAWAGLDVGAVPPDRLTRLDFVSRIEAGPGRIALAGIDARLDASHLSGAIAYRPARPRPMMEVDLTLDRLNADAYLAAGPKGPAAAAPARSPKQEGGEGPLAFIDGIDGRFALRIGMLTVHAMPLREVSAHGRLDDGWLRLDPLLIADVGGARITLSGEIGDWAAARSPHLDLHASLRHPSLSGFARAFALPLTPSAEGGIAIDATARGRLDALTLAPLAVALGPMRIEGKGVLALAEPRPSLALDVRGTALDLDALLGPGAGDDADESGAPRPAGAAPWSHAPLDLSALALLDADLRARVDRVTWRGWRLDEPALTLTLRKGGVTLSDATARLFEGMLALAGSLHGGADGVPSLTASLRLDDADAAQAAATLVGQSFLTGRLDAAAEIAASGASPYDLVSDLQGAMEFAAEDGVLRGLDLPRLSARLDDLGSREGVAKLVAASLAGGETPYRRIGGTAEIRDGILRTSDMQAEIAAAEGELHAEIDLPRYWLDALYRFRLSEYPDAPAIGLAFVGPLDAPERRIESEELRRYAAVHLLRSGVGPLLQDHLSDEESRDEAGLPERGGRILRDLGGDLLRGLGERRN